jgi:hypothetical protein
MALIFGAPDKRLYTLSFAHSHQYEKACHHRLCSVTRLPCHSHLPENSQSTLSILSVNSQVTNFLRRDQASKFHKEAAIKRVDVDLLQRGLPRDVHR